MRSIQRGYTKPLAEVKPLEPLLSYRAYCVEATRQAREQGAVWRDRSPVSGAPLQPAGTVEGLRYGRCPEGGGVFLQDLATEASWAALLSDITRYRGSSNTFHAHLRQSRADHVYTPKMQWIHDTLRLHGIATPSVVEVATLPSAFTTWLTASGLFAEVFTHDETAPASWREAESHLPVQAALLMESLDRVSDPAALLRAVVERVEPGGLVFITALVASGFDLAVLGFRNVYLYPPDRTNCFTREGLVSLLERQGLTLMEVSTPGLLDVEIVEAHLRHDPSTPLSVFERQLIQADAETRAAFQAFLQERALSSFARIVARKPS